MEKVISLINVFQVSLRLSKYQNHVALLICCLFWIFYALLRGTIQSGYHFMDDHLIVSIVDRLQSENVFEVIQYYINVYEPATRFRPLFWVMKVVEGKLLGDNIYLHSLYLTTLGGLTSFFIYLFSKNIGFSLIESILFVLLTLIGGQSENWWMTGAAENRGMLFVAVALYIYSNSYRTKRDSLSNKVIFCLLVILASLSKESFILFIPALLCIRILLPFICQRESILSVIKTNWFVVIFLLTIMILELFFIYKRGTDFGYAGVDSGLPLSKYFQTLESYFNNNVRLILVINILLSTGLLLILRNKIGIYNPEGLIDWYLFIFLFAPVVVIPQVLLYAKSGIEGRYLVPISLGLAFLMIAPVNYVRASLKELPKFYGIILSMVIILPSIILLSKRFKESNSTAYSFAYRGYENDIIRSIDEHTVNDHNKVILIVLNPTEIPTLEIQSALDVYIKKLLRKNNPIYFQLISQSNSPDSLSGFQRQIFEMIVNQSKDRQIQDINNKSNIASIVIFHNLEDNFLTNSKDWFFPQKYKRIEGLNFIHYYE